MNGKLIKDLKGACYAQIVISILLVVIGIFNIHETKRLAESSIELEKRYKEFAQVIRSGGIDSSNREQAARLFEEESNSTLEKSEIYYKVAKIYIGFGVGMLILPIVTIISLRRFENGI